jgi:hypothetical protein
MKRHYLLFAVVLLAYGLTCHAQNDPKPEKATAAVLRAFKTHDIVMLGEFHDNKQLYQWLGSLVATPEFADRVDDIVMEMGNSLYQKSVDGYVSGEDVSLEQVQKHGATWWARSVLNPLSMAGSTRPSAKPT